MQETNHFVDMSTVNDTIVLEIRYATTNNFTGRVIYESAQCYVHQDVAHALDRVQKNLENHGLGLKIWDGYRPLSAQQILFDCFPDERYVSPPSKGGRLTHTRGTAIDVTLIVYLAGNFC